VRCAKLPWRRVGAEGREGGREKERDGGVGGGLAGCRRLKQGRGEEHERTQDMRLADVVPHISIYGMGKMPTSLAAPAD